MDKREKDINMYDAKLTLSTLLELLETISKQVPRAVNLINNDTNKKRALAINQISYARDNVAKAVNQLNNAINNLE